VFHLIIEPSLSFVSVPGRDIHHVP
jgi:hypothetical protein